MKETHFLDANICIYALKGQFPAIEPRIKSLKPTLIKIASIVKAELLYGAEKSNNPERMRTIIEEFLVPYDVVPFCERSARHYAKIRAELERKGKVIGPNDLILAATALANDARLVTHNVEEFRRVKGLRIEDWTR